MKVASLIFWFSGAVAELYDMRFDAFQTVVELPAVDVDGTCDSPLEALLRYRTKS